MDAGPNWGFGFSRTRGEWDADKNQIAACRFEEVGLHANNTHGNFATMVTRFICRTTVTLQSTLGSKVFSGAWASVAQIARARGEAAAMTEFNAMNASRFFDRDV
jgi:hypothetical protein